MSTAPVIRSLRHAAVVDPVTADVQEDQHIRIEADRIVAVEDDPGTPVGSEQIDARGLFAIPGLIDCHVHALSVTDDLPSLLTGSLTYLGIAAGRLLTETLRRGFTTVRDCGGADWGMAAAVREGIIPAPDLLYCGRALSQSGGQGDARRAGEHARRDSSLPDISRVTDGPLAVRTAVRDEARKGASFVKLLAEVRSASGWRSELADDEVAAAVEEAHSWGIPVTAHAYSPARVMQLTAFGVDCIEHGNQIDEQTAAVMADAGVHYVPTLGAYRSYAEGEGDRGIDDEEQRWAGRMVGDGIRALEHAERAGVVVGFGTDLTVSHERQNEEFTVRADVQSLPALLRSATTDAARILRRDDRGRIAPGLRADILLTRTDPLSDVDALAQPERNHALVVAGGLLRVDRR